MERPPDAIAAGRAALLAADWPRARTCFEAALCRQESAEAHDGLGLALWWLNEIEAAHRHRAAAYRGFKQRGEFGRAAAIAAWLAREQVFLSGNASAMQGWFARGERLLGAAGVCAERGWFAVLRASMLDDAENLEQASQASIDLARAFDDPDLEAMALAFGGLARVALGRVADGMAHLDEAMAAALGEETRHVATVSEVFCVTLSACELAHDLVRTEHWCAAAADFARRYRCSFLAAYCRTTYGGLLITRGRWQDAEAELLAAIRAFEVGHRALRVHAVLRLADLRVRQGRLDEAEAMLVGYEDHAAATVPLARLHLARGNGRLARAIVEQRLPPSQPVTLDRVPLLLLWLDALLALGDVAAAHGAVEQLAEVARRAPSDLLWAQAALAAGRVKRQAGDAAAADRFREALDHLRSCEQSLLAGRARLEMARLLVASDAIGAVAWAWAALATFERLGAAHDIDEASEVLRRLGVAGRTGPRRPGKLTQRETEVLALLARGRSNREIADRLCISPKTVEHHVTQILGKLGARSRAEAVAFAVGGHASEAGR